jgi:hypothetical protein
MSDRNDGVYASQQAVPRVCNNGIRAGNARRARIVKAAFLSLLLALPLAAGTKTQSTSAQAVKILSFSLRLNSMQPSSLTVPEGRYNLQLINGLVLGEVSFQLDSASQTGVAAGKVERNRAKKAVVVDLAAGTYVLQVPGHSKWVCRITVTK